MCCTDGKKSWNGAQCALKFHDENFFGLAKIDCKLFEDRPGTQWKAPNQNDYRWNKRHIQQLLHNIDEVVTTANEDEREKVECDIGC